MDIANVWLQSGFPASIRGARLQPVVHPRYDNLAHREEGAQGEAYHLIQESKKREWILKKFKPETMPDQKYLVAIRRLVPTGISCIAATKRLVLASEDLKSGEGTYSSPELAKWLQDTILMPKVHGTSWKELTSEIRSGHLTFDLSHRLAFAGSLASTISSLEDNGCAHRDLSQHNLFLDTQEYVIYLVDWDSLFHGSLYFHKNTPAGTEGYIPPWIKDNFGKWDARKSWNKKGDRFALAILVSELLLVDQDAPAYYDGALFSQEMYANPGHAYLNRARIAMEKISEPLGDLFYSTINAKSYDNCPSPLKWKESLEALHKEEPPEGESSEDIFKESAVLLNPELSSSVEPSFKRVHYLLIVLILASAVLLAELYQNKKYDRSLWTMISTRINQKDQNTKDTKATKSGKEQTREAESQILENKGNIPAVTIAQGTENKAGLRKYFIAINYSGDDLKMSVDNQQVSLSKDNTAQINLAPGEHSVTFIYTGVIILPNGDRRPDTTQVPQTQKVRFGQKDRLTFQINRNKRIWFVVD